MMALPATVLEAEGGGLNGVGWCLHGCIRRCRHQPSAPTFTFACTRFRRSRGRGGDGRD